VGPDVPCAGYDSAVAIKLRLEYAVCDISSMSLDALCGIRIQSSWEIYQMKAGEGVVDQVAGAVKDTAGWAAQAVGQTVHDLNR